MDRSLTKRRPYQYDFDSDFGSDTSTNYGSSSKKKMKKTREKKSKSPPQSSTRNIIMAKRRVKRSPEEKENCHSPGARSKRDLMNLSGFEVMSPTMKTFKGTALTPLQRSIFTRTKCLGNSANRANSVETGDRQVSKASTSTPQSSTLDADVEDSRQPPRKRRTFEVNPEDSILLNTSGKKSPKNRRTFELDEPSMPENKRKSEIFSKSALKNRKEVKVVFESPWKNAMVSDDDEICEGSSNESVSHKVTFNINKTPPQRNAGKALLKKNASVDTKLSRLNSNSKSITKSRTKMPNFARIHKNALEKLAGIDDYALQKAERAKALMSGSKVKIGVSSSEKKLEVSSKKFLEFEPKSQSCIKKQVGFSTPPKKIIAPLQFVTPNNENAKKSSLPTLKNTPYKLNTPQKLSNEFNAKKSSAQLLQNSSRKFNTPQKLNNEKPNGFNTIKSSVQSLRNTPQKTPKKIKTPPKLYKPIGDGKSKDLHSGKINKTSGFKEKNAIKSFKELKAANNQLGVILPGRGLKLSPRKKLSPKKVALTNNLNYKAKPKLKESKDDLIKAVAAKLPVAKDAVNERRALIKGVRSNRRFDLLMNMRKLK